MLQLSPYNGQYLLQTSDDDFLNLCRLLYVGNIDGLAPNIKLRCCGISKSKLLLRVYFNNETPHISLCLPLPYLLSLVLYFNVHI